VRLLRKGLIAQHKLQLSTLQQDVQQARAVQIGQRCVPKANQERPARAFLKKNPHTRHSSRLKQRAAHYLLQTIQAPVAMSHKVFETKVLLRKRNDGSVNTGILLTARVAKSRMHLDSPCLGSVSMELQLRLGEQCRVASRTRPTIHVTLE
jgi:hypothetical protein